MNSDFPNPRFQPCHVRSDKYRRSHELHRPVYVFAAGTVNAVAWFWGVDAEANADEYVRFKNGVEK